MQDFKLEKKSTLISPSGERFPLNKNLGEGSFGRVISSGPDKIVKVIKSRDATAKKHMMEEITIQQKINEKVPDVCPKLYAYGLIPASGEYAIIMERCDGTARDLFKTNPDPELVLQYYEQIATILQKLEPYQFNHRDLKSDNVMYKIDPATGKHKFLLIDFGFSCITVDGQRYQGTSYFTPTEKCFRRSRDLAALVFESLYFLKGGDIRTFAQLVLTFQYKGKTCDMSKGCAPGFPKASWSHTYDFLNKDSVDNPNTTPEGLIKAVQAYRQGGLQSCQAGFVVHPIANQCVPIPPPPAPAALQVAQSPKPHLASPAPAQAQVPAPSPAKTLRTPCPPGKVRNPKTRRCVKVKAPPAPRIPRVLKAPKTPKAPNQPAPCPPGKVRNPATGRCIKQKP